MDTARELPASADVVIVGAGPTGLSMACALAGYGVRIVLIDAKPQSTSRSNALVVHARTLETLHELGAAEQLGASGVAVPRFIIRDHDRALVNIPFDELATPFPHLLMVPQNRTEEVLEGRLHALGEQVWRPYEVTRLERDGAGYTVRAAAEDGTAVSVRSRYVVGCDGMHSTVRAQLGVEFAGATYGQPFVLADVRMSWGLPRDEVDLFFSPHGLVVVAPFGTDQHRVVAPVEDAPGNPGAADVHALLAQRGPSAQRPAIRELVWSSRFLVHHRLASRFRIGGAFLCGDAAHVHSPAGGQGMNTGIQDAHNLAWKLAMVLAGTADERLLDSYEAERRPVAQHVVATTDRLTRAATLRRRPGRRLRNLLFRAAGRVPAVRHRLAMELSQLAVSYAAGRSAAASRRPKVGDRAPLELLPATSSRPRWRLLLPAGSGDSAGRSPVSVAAVVQASAVPIAVQVSPAVALAVLVRPDGYVWSSAPQAQASRLVTALPGQLHAVQGSADAPGSPPVMLSADQPQHWRLRHRPDFG